MSMDVSLKQRLIGAVVLILLAVIFLPLLVKGPAPDSGVNASMRMPSEPRTSGGTVTEDLPLDVPAGALPMQGATGMPAPVQGQATAPAPDAATPLAAVAGGDFVVSFGNYKDAADADRVIAALRAAGLPGYSEKIQLANREAQRVRIGPFSDQATAESARIRAGQVNSAAGAKVIALDAAAAEAAPATAASSATAPPKPAVAATPAVPAPAATAAQAAVKPAPVTTAPAVAKPAPVSPVAVATKPAVTPAATGSAEPPPRVPANPAATGFVVQMGAFSDAAAATTLRDKLRSAGFNAFTDTVPSDKGKLTRVRVGPVMTRAEADALKAQVKSKAGLDGSVRPHP